jgi:phosphoheptose isomerase
MTNLLISRYPSLKICKESIDGAIAAIINALEHGGTLLLAGNGGSAADCDHIVGELAKGFLLKRPLSPMKKADMKAKSPSCGVGKIYDGTFSRKLIDGDGITAKLLKEHGIKVFDETQINEFLEYISEEQK